MHVQPALTFDFQPTNHFDLSIPADEHLKMLFGDDFRIDKLFDERTGSLFDPNNINDRALKSDAQVHKCNDKYGPSSKEQYLCKHIVAILNNGNGNNVGVVENIGKAIDEIYDSVVVVDIIETAGLSLEDVLLLGK